MIDELKEGQMLFLFYIDLDKFKQINDRFGHYAGDLYLQAVSKVLGQYNGNQTATGRLGGDEFAMLFLSKKGKSFMDVANNIVSQINQIDLPAVPGFYHANASIGIACSPQDGKTINELLANADLAMYRAKKTDNNRVFVYTDDDSDIPVTNFEKRKFISKLINRQQIKFSAQPIFDAHGKLVIAFECFSALANQNDKAPIIGTEQLFSFADDCDMLVELDLYLIGEILKHAPKFKRDCQAGFSGWQVDGDFMLSINVSAKNILNKSFANDLLELFSSAPAGLPRIILEITETSDVGDFGMAKKFMALLHERGIMFALDDFGKGYSSLMSLRYLPFDWVKLDAAFIKQIDQNIEDQIIVESVVQASKRLGLKVLAEGVETVGAYNYCLQSGIDLFQGYYLAKPFPLPHTPRPQPSNACGVCELS